MQVTSPRAPAARPAVAVAGVASIAAGLVHAAAAGNHDGDPTLVWMFALCAAAQLLWGVIAIVTIQPSRPVLVAGLVINGGAIAVWALTRTVGIPFVSSLAEVEAVGRQDLGAALFAGLSVLATGALLVRPSRAPRLAFGWVGGLAVVALLAAWPAMAAEHAHEHGAGGHGHGTHAHGEEEGEAHGDHEHDSDAEGSGDGHSHADGEDHGDGHTDHDESDADGHAHGDLASTGGHSHADGADEDHGHTGSGGGDHGHDPDDPGPHPHPTDPDDPHPHPTDPDDPDDPHPHPTDPDDPDDPHPHPTDPDDPITSIDDPRLTDEQFAIAVGLIVRTGNGMAPFVTEEDVLAAGYTSIGDGGAPGQYTHYINWSLVGDAYELDPAHIESVVMKMNADGTSRVVAAMYILTTGDTMADAPPLAGELTTWHDHDNLCFQGGTFVGLAVGGVCPVGVLGDTPPMLHVWVEANPCGPFAAIDEDGEDCGAPHGH